MVLHKFDKPSLYLRKDPDAGWTLALWKWRVMFNAHRRPKAKEKE
jgi:hypothetical protein